MIILAKNIVSEKSKNFAVLCYWHLVCYHIYAIVLKLINKVNEYF